MVEAAPATGTDRETGEVLVSLSNRANEDWVSRTSCVASRTLSGYTS